jgi:excisionase family DNA binding protein
MDRVAPTRSARGHDTPPDNPELDGQGRASPTKELIIGLQEQVIALTGAVRSLEQRLPSRVVSVDEAAGHLSVSVQTIRRWCKAGLLPYVRRGRELRIDLTKVRALSGEEIRRLADIS